MISVRWDTLVARLKSEAYRLLNRSGDGIVIVTARILVNSDGEPLMWVVDGKVVEPSKDAKRIAINLLRSLTEDGQD